MSEIRRTDQDKSSQSTFKEKQTVKWRARTFSIFSKASEKISNVATRIINQFGIETKSQKSQRIKEKWKKAAKKAAQIGKGSSIKGTTTIKETYWQEVLLPGHPAVDEYQDLFEKWKKADTNLDFAPWLEKEGYVLQGTVEYVDESKRKEYLLSIENGKFYKQGSPYDTTFEQSNFSGIGHAIFVISPDNQIYAGSHSVGLFHHSSFLSGKAVKGAGEIKTNAEGVLIRITSKSGHYKPSKEEVLNVLKILQKKGVPLRDVEVRIITKEGLLTYTDAKRFIANPNQLPDGWESYQFERDSKGTIKKVILNEINVSRVDVLDDINYLKETFNLKESIPFIVNTSAGFLEYSLAEYIIDSNALPNKWDAGEIIKNPEGKITEIRISNLEKNQELSNKLSILLNILQQKNVTLDEVKIVFDDSSQIASGFLRQIQT